MKLSNIQQAYPGAVIRKLVEASMNLDPVDISALGMNGPGACIPAQHLKLSQPWIPCLKSMVSHPMNHFQSIIDR